MPLIAWAVFGFVAVALADLALGRTAGWIVLAALVLVAVVGILRRR